MMVVNSIIPSRKRTTFKVDPCGTLIDTSWHCNRCPYTWTGICLILKRINSHTEKGTLDRLQSPWRSSQHAEQLFLIHVTCHLGLFAWNNAICIFYDRIHPLASFGITFLVNNSMFRLTGNAQISERIPMIRKNISGKIRMKIEGDIQYSSLLNVAIILKLCLFCAFSAIFC